MARVLIIDDDRIICALLSEVISNLGHEVECGFSVQEGLEKVIKQPYDVVFLDVNLPDGNGLNLLPDIKNIPSPPEVIIMTGFGDSPGAKLAIKNGAWDYLQKPISPENITLMLKRVFQYRENFQKAQKPAVVLRLQNLIGSSPQFTSCLNLVAQAATCDLNVLVVGETGTGKELICQAIHDHSSRAQGNLVALDCASLPESLVESILFGYGKGAFTGADQSKAGLFEHADGGTLFLDEVGELPPTIQKTFLRVLEERRFRPVGSNHEKKSDFRVLAATHRNLKQMVKNDQFREDLLFRLQALIIVLPPLRERTQDIPEIVFYYLARLAKKYNLAPKGMATDVLETLSRYSWPGNVRELVHALERAFIAAKHEPTLFLKHFPIRLRSQVVQRSLQDAPAVGVANSRKDTEPSRTLPPYRDFRQQILLAADKNYFQELMALTKGDLKSARQISGLGKTQLHSLLKKYQISRLGWPED
jgi:two-component system, NtrC family, response regulator